MVCKIQLDQLFNLGISQFKDTRVRWKLQEKMKHLKEIEMSYMSHLAHAFSIAGVLIVHGLLPWIWETKASDMLCKTK